MISPKLESLSQKELIWVMKLLMAPSTLLLWLVVWQLSYLHSPLVSSFSPLISYLCKFSPFLPSTSVPSDFSSFLLISSFPTYFLPLNLHIFSTVKGHIAAVQLLVSLGSKLNHKDSSCLAAAVKGGHTELIQYLLTNGTDINGWYVLRW